MFAGRVFKQCTVDLNRDVSGQQILQDLFLGRFVFIDSTAQVFAALCIRIGDGSGNQLLGGNNVGNFFIFIFNFDLSFFCWYFFLGKNINHGNTQ